MDSMIALIVEAHGLSRAEAERLRRVATGAVPGNRDRPLFLLAVSVLRSESDDLLTLVLPRCGPLSRAQAALLDLILTASLEDGAQAARLIGALSEARRMGDPVKALASEFAAILHVWRRQNMLEARNHNVFTAVRRFLKRHRPHDPLPRDGDTPVFWEAEATRDLLARYSTALRALADYAEAARLAATWRDVRSLDDPMATDVSTEEVGMWGWDDPLAPARLEDALATIGEASIKLLLAHERESLGILASYADIVRVWPRDTCAALALGPVQNIVIQAVRRGERMPSSAEFFSAARSLGNIRGHHAELGEALMAALHLIAKTRTLPNETDPNRSNDPLTLHKRIVAMERRQGFAALSDHERAETLGALIEPVLALKVMIDAYLKAWENVDRICVVDFELEHRMLFQRKLDALYGVGAIGQVT
jgi:hypothetical protein